MKGGAENRKKTITAGVLGAAALCAVVYLYSALFGGSSAPTPAPAAPSAEATPVKTTSSSTSASSSSTNATSATGAVPGIAAKVMASTSSSLDPTLDESAMLRTENLVYSGNGRNIFSATYVPEVVIPTNVPTARPMLVVPVVQVPTGPLPPPPINLKFFGTATRANGVKQAFLLSGEDVYLASPGDIVVRKYKIVSIGTSNIQIEDLQNNNTQTLPLLN